MTTPRTPDQIAKDRHDVLLVVSSAASKSGRAEGALSFGVTAQIKQYRPDMPSSARERAITGLRKDGLIEAKRVRHNVFYTLTPAGEDALRKGSTVS